MEKLKILHLASFSGNIGDVANHLGFYEKFRDKVCANIEITKMEVRKFYRNRSELKFDDNFVETVNRHDLLVIGGGGFFDLAWDYSCTGTTIDLSEEIVRKIKKPVLINAIGYHELGDVKPTNVDKFKRFLDVIIENDKWFVSVRNDGSLGRMNNRFGRLSSKVMKVPDNGFFYKVTKNVYRNYIKSHAEWIGLNLSNDLFNVAFNQGLNANVFNRLIVEFIESVLGTMDDAGIIFFPHTPQDISTLGMVLEKVKDKYKREKILVAPLFASEGEAVECVFDMYKACSCVIGMRFHTNVCCVGMNIPTIGLAGHDQISSLYDELGLSERCIKVNNNQFVIDLLCLLTDSLKRLSDIKKEYAEIGVELNNCANAYYQDIKEWVSNRE